MTRGARGPVALFESGEVVAYLLFRRRRARVFVFRTLDVDDRLAATVPGVSPRVRLLFEVRTPGRIRRTRSLFAYLSRTGRDPSDLPDAFYVRIGTVLNGRLPPHKILLPLLSLHDAAPERGSGCFGASSRCGDAANQAVATEVREVPGCPRAERRKSP